MPQHTPAKRKANAKKAKAKAKAGIIPKAQASTNALRKARKVGKKPNGKKRTV